MGWDTHMHTHTHARARSLVAGGDLNGGEVAWVAGDELDEWSIHSLQVLLFHNTVQGLQTTANGLNNEGRRKRGGEGGEGTRREIEGVGRLYKSTSSARAVSGACPEHLGHGPSESLLPAMQLVFGGLYGLTDCGISPPQLP